MKQRHSKSYHTVTTFERISRRIRWMTIVLAILTTPPGQEQTALMYGLTLMAAAYNLCRYVPALLRRRWFAHPVTMLVGDNLLVATFLFAVGSAATPYSALLVLMVVSAAYRYRLKGAVAVTAGQAVFLWIASLHPWYPALTLDEPRTIIIATANLLMIGLLVEQLTHVEREERDALEDLSRENEAERKRLFTLVNSLNDAIIVANGKGRILIHNGAAQNLVSSHRDLHGAKLEDVLKLKQRTRPQAKPVDILAGGQIPQHRRDLSILGDYGSAIDLDVSVTPVQLGEETDYIIVCQDITKERSLDEQREEFISVASHELRTPLAIVEAALSTALIGKDKLVPQTASLIDQAHRNVVFLAGLVRDLTTLSQARNDNLPIKLKPVDAGALLDQLANDSLAQATQQKLSIKVSVDPKTPAVISTENHIREVLQNYLSNALKYTKRGSVTLGAEPNKHGGVIFWVRDSGVGISAADQAHLFTKFYRAEDYRTRETGGTGLGLYLCLELAERLNGKVWCKSVLNEGSTFYLEVPPFSQLERDRSSVTEAQVSSLVDQI